MRDDFNVDLSCLGWTKLSGVDRSAQTRQVHINSHASTCIHHRIQLAVGDVTMSAWKPTISLIPPPNTAGMFDQDSSGATIFVPWTLTVNFVYISIEGRGSWKYLSLSCYLSHQSEQCDWTRIGLQSTLRPAFFLFSFHVPSDPSKIDPT